MKRNLPPLLSVLLGAALLTACGSGDGGYAVDVQPVPVPLTLSLERIGGTAAAGLGAAEINAFDAGSLRLFVVNGARGNVDVLNMANPASPAKLATLDVSDLGGVVNSVAVHEGLVALAIEATPKTAAGKVAFYRADTLARIAVVTVGSQPDMLLFTPDGSRVLTANEGEPNSYGQADSVDPEGSVSVIDLNRTGLSINPAVRTADFRAFNTQLDALRAQGVRVYGPGASVAQDLEPEYIAIDPNGTTAYVTLQENNAIATLDITGARITAVRPLATRNFALTGQGLDPSDEDGGTDTNSGTPAVKIGNWPVTGLPLPDSIGAYTAGGQTYLVTANEGDARADWPGFNEEERVRSYCTAGLDPAVFPGATGDSTDRLLRDSNLGRLRITLAPNGNDNGKNAKGQCNKLMAFGTRSFSIWRANDLNRVYDSGEDFERITAERAAATGATFKFNSSHDNDTMDGRSPTKGPEPEGLALGRIGNQTFAFVGLERVGGVMVYDITDPVSPRFVTYLNPRNGVNGDTGPEGLSFVPATASPTGNPLLVVSHEVSGTTAIFNIRLSPR